jgi:hypothetical protein
MHNIQLEKKGVKVQVTEKELNAKRLRPIPSGCSDFNLKIPITGCEPLLTLEATEPFGMH